MYKCKYFSLKELLPKRFYEENYPHYGDKLWLIFDRRGLETIDSLRETYGKMFVNNWPWGGPLQYCGYRPPDCDVGSWLSQHRFGRAFDLHPLEASVEEIRNDILSGKWPLIRGLELYVSWLHIDFRNASKLITFNP